MNRTWVVPASVAQGGFAGDSELSYFFYQRSRSALVEAVVKRHEGELDII